MLFTLRLKLYLEQGGRLGPGKVELLEHIAEAGSISAAAKRMGMSYKRAWDLVSEMNAMFGKPLVGAQVGGKMGGGATVNEAGRAVIVRYRAIEQAAQAAVETEMQALDDELTKLG